LTNEPCTRVETLSFLLSTNNPLASLSSLYHHQQHKQSAYHLFIEGRYYRREE
jgi:hypothetical protein